MTATILASVIIPAYNQGRFIREAIESALHQDFPQGEIEVIVLDDGSTDDTAEVAGQYGNKIRYSRQNNSGKAFAVKKALELARGKYIFNLDSDDIFLPGKIKKSVEIFEAHPNVACIAGPVIYWEQGTDRRVPEKIPVFVKKGRSAGKEVLLSFYRRNKFFGGGSSFAVRASVAKHIPIDQQSIGFAVDFYMAISALNAGDFFCMEEPLSLYRLHGENYSSKERRRADHEAMRGILSEISSLNFDAEVKNLQKLKTLINELRMKEEMRTKKIADVKRLWSFIFSERKSFSAGLLPTIRAYDCLKRSLPNFLYSRKKKKVSIGPAQSP